MADIAKFYKDYLLCVREVFEGAGTPLPVGDLAVLHVDQPFNAFARTREGGKLVVSIRSETKLDGYKDLIRWIDTVPDDPTCLFCPDILAEHQWVWWNHENPLFSTDGVVRTDAVHLCEEHYKMAEEAGELV